jgi:CheY-like chemotaxis protein
VSDRQTSASGPPSDDVTRVSRCEAAFRSFYVAPCTVFVVEDDVDTRDMMGRFLELEGFTVEVAANGKQALERLNAGMHPCVILLDLMMPVMDGWQFRSQQIRDAALASIPVIVVSAAGKERMGDIEANAYLSKPVDLEQLLAEVTQYCSTR